MSKTPQWHSFDPLGESLHFLRMNGVFYSQCEFGGTWGLGLPALDNCLMFHAVTSGTCRLEAPDIPACTLRAGDFVLVPHGQGHRLLSHAGAPATYLFDLPRQRVSDTFEFIRHGDGDTSVRMVCGAVRFDHPTGDRLVSVLPSLIHLDATSKPVDGMNDVLQFMAAEAKSVRPGGEAVVSRLADILVIQTIRAWISSEAHERVGWLYALRDKQIGRALALIHKAPEHPWTLTTLASEIGMSRSAFAGRFTQLVGESVMQYLTHWRMHAARAMLREHAMSVSELSLKFGYQSEAAFNRVFKRVIGTTPGAVKREALAR